MSLEQINPFLKGKLPRTSVDLKTKVINSIDVKTFFEEHVENFNFSANQNCPFPDHRDNAPSFRAREDGSYKCFGCDKGGSSIVQFWLHLNNKKDDQFDWALSSLYTKYVVPKSITQELILEYQRDLKKSQEFLGFLTTTRGWKPEIINYFELGLTQKDECQFITIPVKDEFGFYSTVIYYNALHQDRFPKFLYHPGGENSQKVFGLEVFTDSPKVYIFEGQPDWLLALSLGYPAVTFGSATSWKDSWAPLFKMKDVVICYDNDEAGERGKNLVSSKILTLARSIKIIKLPKKDFTEFILERNSEAFQELEKQSEYFKLPEVDIKHHVQLTDADTHEVTLTKAGNSEYFGKRIKLVALVSGKEPSPLLVPRKIQMTCQDNPNDKKCLNCALGKMPAYSQIFDIEENQKELLQWAVTPSKDHSKSYRTALGVNTRCKVDIEVTKMWNLEKIILNNPVRFGKLYDLPEQRLGFFLGTGLVPTRHYIFTGYTLQHPIDNSATHLMMHAEPLDTELEDFKLEGDLRVNINVFKTKDIDSSLKELYELYSKNVTRIWGRPLLHFGLDLPFYSPNHFIFADEEVKRASLDVIIFGDQRCGKGKIAEGLSEYYRFGEVLSGENTSFMNLVGGIESSGLYRGLKWGRLVANNGGVVILDEASALEVDTIGKLSRIRSEGIAELDKFGIHAKAMARCSLIWLSNPRNDSLSSYNFGVEALRELIGASEDIARFDYAIAVKTNEVSSEEINRSVDRTTDHFGYQLHRGLILWCKTRRTDQIEFVNDSIQEIYKGAIELGSTYSPVIPLVQAENIRIKIAKIAAAIAGRVFSCNEQMDKLWIQPVHIRKAVAFLKEIYETTPIAYKAYSNMQRAALQLQESEIELIFKSYSSLNVETMLLNGLLRIRDIHPNDISDMTGGKITFYDSRQIISQLTKAGALQRQNVGYRKTNQFIQFIKHRLILLTGTPGPIEVLEPVQDPES